jgi:hypothetical protein
VPSKYVEWSVYPSYLNNMVYDYTYDIVSETYNVTITKDQLKKLPTNENIFFIGTVYWHTNANNANDPQRYTQSTMFLNVVYKIKFVEVLKPIIIVPETRVLIGETLVLDSS